MDVSDGRDRGRCDCNECAEKSKCVSVAKPIAIDVCLRRLTELDLGSSGVAVVPKCVENLVNITKLDLSSNGLAALPSTFAGFLHITDLSLSRNRFVEFPRCLVVGLPSVVHLDLSHNDLSSVEPKPFCVRRLRTLNVSNNRKLHSFPAWLWSVECESLESLDTSFTNCLDDVRADPYQNMYGIGAHLKHIDVSSTNCNVQKLDFVKHLKNLRTAVLGTKDGPPASKQNNYFNKIPLVFNFRFKSVTSLSMSNVDLSMIGKLAHFSLPNLQFLDLSKNSIVSLPESFCNLNSLETLDLSNNQIWLLPDCIKNLTTLKKLILNDNWLSLFPNIVDDLLNLEFLDLYNNRLVVCPLWNSTSNIKSLDLEQNIFSTESISDKNVTNYPDMLYNLRLSIDGIRKLGPTNDSSELECSNDSGESSSHWSSEQNISDKDIDEETENQENTNFEPEEVWECNSYSETTGLFDPKEFESTLINDLIKFKNSLAINDQTNDTRKLKNIVYSTNEHYFCPSDELPKVINKFQN